MTTTNPPDPEAGDPVLEAAHALGIAPAASVSGALAHLADPDRPTRTLCGARVGRRSPPRRVHCTNCRHALTRRLIAIRAAGEDGPS